ncbi:MAG TPA: sialidase family protein, partial [Bacteroidota bacterium]|nr:sialidase family protein [Bacteroidota bacterium]
MNSQVIRIFGIPAVLLLIFAEAAYASGRNGPRTDTLMKMSHERYFEELFRRQPPMPIRPPILHPLGPQSTFPNIDISRDTFPQNEPSVRISHKDPNQMCAAWRDFRTGVTPAVRRVGYSFSTDGGVTWGPTDLLPRLFQPEGYTRNSDPAVCVDTAGNFYVATIALNDNDASSKIIVYKSILGGSFVYASFAPSDTADPGYDKEYIVCDLNASSPFVNNLYIVSSGSRFTRSTDEGANWSSAVSTNGVGGFAPDLCVGRDGSVNVVSGVGSALWFDKSTDGGVSFGVHSVVVDSIDYVAPHVGRPSFPSIACDVTDGPSRGHLYSVWTDTTYGDADVFLGVSRDGGQTWSKGRRVNDDSKRNGKDQYWPWIAVDDRGVVSIVYYDTRNTPDSSYFQAYLAYSWDGGLTFTNRLISTAQSPRNQPNGAVRFGDYIGLDSWGKHTVPVWTDERAGGFDMSIYTALLDTLPLVNFSGVTVSVARSWNMISLPVLPPSMPAESVFPTRTSIAFAFAGTYVPSDTLRIGSGYWLRFGSPESIRVFGDTLTADSISVGDGWNLFGSITNPVPIGSVTSDPPGLIVSRFFDFGAGYRSATTISPG